MATRYNKVTWARDEDAGAMLRAAGTVDRRRATLAASACVRTVLRPDGAALRALEVAEAWARSDVAWATWINMFPSAGRDARALDGIGPWGAGTAAGKVVEVITAVNVERAAETVAATVVLCVADRLFVLGWGYHKHRGAAMREALRTLAPHVRAHVKWHHLAPHAAIARRSWHR